MSYNPNSKRHKANHGGYRTKPSKAKVKAILNFFDTSDFNKVVVVVEKPEEVKPKLGTQLELF